MQDTEDDDASALIESFDEAMSDNEHRSERLLEIMRTCDHRRLSIILKRLQATGDTKQLSGTLNVWFSTMTRCFRDTVFRLHEMDAFIPGHALLLYYSANVPWLESILMSIYDEVLVGQLDSTIFYARQFLHEHFALPSPITDTSEVLQERLTVQRYLRDFIYGPTKAPPYSPPLHTHYIDITFLDAMAYRSINHYYREEGDLSRRYNCIDSVPVIEPYLISHAKKRSQLFYTIVSTFLYLRHIYQGVQEEPRDAGAFIRHLFKEGVAALHGGDDFQAAAIKEGIHESAYLPVAEQVDSLYEGYNDSDPYTVLFDGNIEDGHDWLRLFNEEEFKEKMEETDATIVEQELNEIRVQESIVWINMLIFELYTENPLWFAPEREKKRKVSKSKKQKKHKHKDKGKKKRKLGASTLTELEEGLNLLHISECDAHLLVHQEDGTVATYHLKQDTEITIPRELQYEVQYI